jgi:hypothetical protein
MPVNWDINAIIKDTRDKANTANTAVANWVKSEALRLIDLKPKHGRLYVGAPFRIGRPPHKASAPGEAPAVDTGSLRRSIRVETASSEYLESQVIAGGQGVDYAYNLEYGVPTGPFPLEARPFMRPATMAGEKKAQEIFNKEFGI